MKIVITGQGGGLAVEIEVADGAKEAEVKKQVYAGCDAFRTAYTTVKKHYEDHETPKEKAAREVQEKIAEAEGALQNVRLAELQDMLKGGGPGVRRQG